MRLLILLALLCRCLCCLCCLCAECVASDPVGSVVRALRSNGRASASHAEGTGIDTRSVHSTVTPYCFPRTAFTRTTFHQRCSLFLFAPHTSVYISDGSSSSVTIYCQHLCDFSAHTTACYGNEVVGKHTKKLNGIDTCKPVALTKRRSIHDCSSVCESIKIVVLVTVDASPTMVESMKYGFVGILERWNKQVERTD